MVADGAIPSIVTRALAFGIRGSYGYLATTLQILRSSDSVRRGALPLSVRSAPLTPRLDMPDIDGFATARALRHRFPEIRLVALSGFLDEENRRQASLIGFDRYFAKGISFGELREAIDELVQQGWYKHARVSPALGCACPPPR